MENPGSELAHEGVC